MNCMNKSNIRILYKIDGLPIFQNRTYISEQEAKKCPTRNIVLVESQETGLIYNSAFLATDVVYDINYQNEQAGSSTFILHLAKVSYIIEKYLGRNNLVEIGCGKGFFLELLLKNGFGIHGFDPTYEGDNPCVQKCNFIKGAGVKADGIILRHVLEHIDNPYEFLVSLKNANDGKGIVYIEVPCFDWICQHRAWFDIYYEHVNYFRLIDFKRMFDNVVDSGHLFGGQYIYVVVDLNTIKDPKYIEKERIAYPDFTFPDFEHSAAIWGGASKGVIFSLIMQRKGCTVTNVIDINPAKQGRYLPVTGLKVQSPIEAMRTIKAGSTIYVMNPNYLNEIKQVSNNMFNYIGAENA